MKYFLDHKQTVFEDLLEEFKKDPITEKNNDGRSPDRKKRKLSTLFDKFDKTNDSGNNKKDDSSPEMELDKYSYTPNIDVDQTPILWRHSNKNFFPRMYWCAIKYLCGQGTSVPSERVFRRGGLVVSDNRTLLTSEHASQLIFLGMNKKYMC